MTDADILVSRIYMMYAVSAVTCLYTVAGC